MRLQPVTSENVAAVGYDAQTRIMRVAFHSGGVYDYYDVAHPLFEQMLLPHPWRRLGAAVKTHRYRRAA